jgi:hypothetical protein
MNIANEIIKATILSKATEYISHLEKRNRSLLKENSGLKDRIDAFELLVMGRQGLPIPSQQRRESEMDRRGSRANGGGGNVGSYGGKY